MSLVPDHGMIYRNCNRAAELTWEAEWNPLSGEIARDFLRGEHDLLKLARARTSAIVDLHVFLENAAGRPLSVYRAESGEVLIVGGTESLLITGRTADVLRAYLDEELVLMSDRGDMTLRLKTA
jgi:hypothetical protein